MHEIVVPLDQSTLAERAVVVARSVAEATGASIRLIQIVSELDTASASAYLESVARSLLPSNEPAVEAIPVPVGVPVADALLDRISADLDEVLLCMGTHGRSGLGSALMGSTAEDVLRRTTQPILLVGHRCVLPWPGHGRSVLVPIDGLESYPGLIGPVADVVREGRLQPVLIKVSRSFDAEDADRFPSRVEDIVESLTSVGVEAKLVQRFASNVPLALTEAALEWGAALIVMATQVEPGVHRTLQGSISMRTVHDSPCPVLLYPRTRSFGEAEHLGLDGAAGTEEA